MSLTTHVFDLHGLRPSLRKMTGSSEETFRIENVNGNKYHSIFQLSQSAAELPKILSTKEGDVTCDDFSELKLSSRIPFWALWDALDTDISLDSDITFLSHLGSLVRCSPRSIIEHGVKCLTLDETFKKSSALSVFPIPNRWDERVQEKLLRTLPGMRKSNRLLWAPVAILLAWIKTKSENQRQSLCGKSVVVLDFGISSMEATLLEMRIDEDYVVPVRSLPTKQNHFYHKYSPFDLAYTQSLATHLNCLENIHFHQLAYGVAATYQLLNRRTDSSRSYLIGQPGGYFDVAVSSDIRDGLVLQALEEEVFRKRIESIHSRLSISLKQSISLIQVIKKYLIPWINDIPSNIDHVVISGPLADIDLGEFRLGKHLHQIIKEQAGISSVFSSCYHAIADGAALYGQREQLNLPTYFDTLPEYKVYAIKRQLGERAIAKFYTLVEGKEIRGGETWTRPEPVDWFSVKAMSQNFKITIQRQGYDKYKEVPASLPEKPRVDEPVLIYPEMRAASGFAKLRIKPKNNPELFGSAGELVMEWDKADDIDSVEELPKDNFSYPFIEPTKGQLTQSLTAQSDMRTFLDQHTQGSILTTDEIITLEDLLVPKWNQEQLEQIPGAFGNLVVEMDDDIQRLTKSLALELMVALEASSRSGSAGSPYSKTCRLLGFMYAYTPLEFLDYLGGFFNAGRKPTMNEIISVGRTFHTPESFTSYLNMCAKTLHIPVTNNGWYWWAFFRCFYYYPDIVKVDEDLVLKFYVNMLNFLNDNKYEKATGRAPASLGSQIKFCLCGVLYGLRVREINPEFLSDESVIQIGLIKVLKEMQTQIRIPPMAGQVVDEIDLNFNSLVIRFLKHEATEDDVGLIHNYTHSMS
jgi:hypothetical protein